MALREELESTGVLLFRGRSYYPLILFAAVALTLRNEALEPRSQTSEQLWHLACLAVGLFGLAIRSLTVGFVAQGTSGRSVRAPCANCLNTTGMYSLVRHPLYLGNYFLWLGPAMLPRSWSLVLIVTLAFWIYYERIMIAEEEFLRRRFGVTFESWAARTPAFLPRPWQWRRPECSFSLRVVFKRECWGLIGLVLCLVVLELIRDVFVPGRFVLDPLWIGVGMIALVTAALIELTKRVTRYVKRRASPPDLGVPA